MNMDTLDQQKRYHQLLTKLNDEIIPDANDPFYQHFKFIVKPHLTRKQHAMTGFLEICKALETCGHLGPDNLGLMKEVFSKDRNTQAFDLIEKTEKNIKGLWKREKKQVDKTSLERDAGAKKRKLEDFRVARALYEKMITRKEVEDVIRKKHETKKNLVIVTSYRHGRLLVPVFLVYADNIEKKQEEFVCGYEVLLQNYNCVNKEGRRALESIFRKLSEDENNDHKGSNIDANASDIKEAQLMLNSYSDILFESHSNLNAIFVSSTRSMEGGTLVKDEICITLCCNSKGFIPWGETAFPTHLEKFGTDVQEDIFTFGAAVIGHSFLSAPLVFKTTQNLGPNALQKGSEIRFQRNGANATSTLGSFVKTSKGLGFITCAHFLKPEAPQCIYTHDEGQPIVAYHMDKDIGYVGKAVFDICRNPGVDACFVELMNTESTDHFEVIPMLIDDSFGYKNQKKVFIKFGSKSGRTTGHILFPKMDIRIRNLRECGSKLVTTKPEILKGQYGLCGGSSDLFQPGDSGSCVFCNENENENNLYCIGMAVGFLTSGITVVTPIKAICDALV